MASWCANIVAPHVLRLHPGHSRMIRAGNYRWPVARCCSCGRTCSPRTPACGDMPHASPGWDAVSRNKRLSPAWAAQRLAHWDGLSGAP